ncbi:related to pyridoxine 4-dehydrogenase [Serendipita indica DSM 11827]|uniref:Related to pyridoxine 4-dehydrogenase n=1 Tax=Serendipita indica (strain DSM 11827) TaxID=1109443 RepID=G4TF70_SERID|nr:related to pyridoxine 4-dehydrogenase [Serendipita indica DSM 11827]
MATTNKLYHTLGQNGPKLPGIGYGAMTIEGGYGGGNTEEAALEILRTAAEECTLIDTSNVYGDPRAPGRNESLIGKLLQDREYRSKVFICTKFGLVMGIKDGSLVIDARGDPEYVRQCCEESLKRLQVDQIDLYYQHRVDRSRPIEETWGELKKLQEEGKVKYLGISEATPDEIRRAHAIAPITALQIEFSPFTPDIRENGILDTCRELGIAIVAYSPLGRGMISGEYTSPDQFEASDYRRFMPRFQGEAFTENLKLVEAIKNIASKKGVSPTQLTLAWVLAQGEDFFVIPGTRSLSKLKDNIAAGSITISEEEKEEIESVIARIKVIGDRAFSPAGVKLNAW